jgi:hypothetical protein
LKHFLTDRITVMTHQVNLEKPLMPRAKAVWLIDNTALSFTQIGTFCDMHSVEVQALADEDVGRGMVGRSPIEDSELTQEEIDRCQADPDAQLRINKRANSSLRSRSKGPRYTPVAKRGDKPNAIAFLVKQHPELTDAQICKLVGTTKPTIKAIREKTHSSSSTIKPNSPADLGLCSYIELDEAIKKGLIAKGIDPEEHQRKADAAKAEKHAQDTAEADSTNSSGSNAMAGFDFSAFMSTGAASKE